MRDGITALMKICMHDPCPSDAREILTVAQMTNHDLDFGVYLPRGSRYTMLEACDSKVH